jgi:hypothetical protein
MNYMPYANRLVSTEMKSKNSRNSNVCTLKLSALSFLMSSNVLLPKDLDGAYTEVENFAVEKLKMTKVDSTKVDAIP